MLFVALFVAFVALRVRATKEQQNNDITGVFIAKSRNFLHNSQMY